MFTSNYTCYSENIFKVWDRCLLSDVWDRPLLTPTSTMSKTGSRSLQISVRRTRDEWRSFIISNLPHWMYMFGTAGTSMRNIITIKNAVFWDVAPCRSCVNRRFGGKYRLHLQGRKIRERGTSVSRWLQSAAKEVVLLPASLYLLASVILLPFTNLVR
jgi:hypothetical protein